MNLLITDFDGTLYNNNYKENIKFLKKLKNTDIVVATGRNYPSLKKDLKLKCKYYICNDGGYILDSMENLLYRNKIDYNIVKELYKRIKKMNIEEYFFDNIKEFSKEIINDTNKLSVKIRNNNPIIDMNKLVNGIDNIYAYLSPNWINILSSESKKENAIEFIINKNNYDNIYVIGNDINDYDMIKKYNGYLIGKDINNFLDIKDILKQ